MFGGFDDAFQARAETFRPHLGADMLELLQRFSDAKETLEHHINDL
jgi:hypothetical protein